MSKRSRFNNRQSIKKSMIKCPNCTYMSVIPRQKSRSKERGHLKNFHCPNCDSYQKHLEITNYDSYIFKKKNGYLGNIKIYRDKRRIELKINTSNIYFRAWDELENSLITRSIILNSDYNLIETFILNYLEGDEFEEDINCNYNDSVEPTDEIVLKFNISKSIYDRFKLKCEENGMLETRVLHHILEYIFNNDIDLEIKNN